MTYLYETEDGRLATHEQALTHPQPPPETITLEDGAVARRVWGSPVVPTSRGWPLECIASGVHADDAQKLRDEFNRLGVPTEVSQDGNPIYRSPEHRRRALKARGFVDRSSYY